MTEEKEINLYDLWKVIKKYRVLIIFIFIISVIISMTVSLREPKIYRATASILLPQQTTSGTELTALVSNLKISGIPSQVNSINIFMAILKSKSIANVLVHKFNLQNIYKTRTKDDAIRTIRDNTNIAISNEQIIRISVIDKNPKIAAELANAYIPTLNKLISKMTITRATQSRIFIEGQLKRTEVNLRKYEDALRTYQVKHKILAKASTAGQLQGQYLAKKIELQAKEKYLTPENPEIIELKNEVTKMGEAMANIPPLETELGRLERNLQTEETLYTLLRSQYEQAKIEEAKDIPTVQFLDKATTPERKYRPIILKNMEIAGAASLFLGIFLSFFIEFIRREKTVK